jgi:hypothetical protein
MAEEQGGLELGMWRQRSDAASSSTRRPPYPLPVTRRRELSPFTQGSLAIQSPPRTRGIEF